ncbi:XRE family transcriptional regulator [Streptomyces murinus]|nr:tetratricopeptide repeat protein [Streptomyces murinus]
MKEMNRDFGGELRRRRSEKGISLICFSRMVSYSKSHLSKVETGKTRASRKFAEICDERLEAKGGLVALVSVGNSIATTRGTAEGFVGLPAPVSHFVGRSEELACISQYLANESTGALCVLSGMAGAGKTALALRGAWNAAASFPDGCFFFDFGEEAPGATPGVLESLLGFLDVPKDQLPPRPDALANLWRSRIGGKRLLIVLDNVRSATDVTPLLSTEPGCKIIVTSRKRLGALDDATRLHVGILSNAEADALFRAVGGDRAAHAEGDSVRAVVELCGYLPLAVRIIAARFRSGPMRTMAELEEMLAHEAGRLDLLDDGDRSVTAALTVSCNELTTERRRLLALLALHPGVSAHLSSVAAMADIDLHRAAVLMDGLADVHLVAYESSDRIMMHGLVRQFARQVLLSDVAVVDQRNTVRRLIEHGLHFAVAADRLLTPQRYRPPVILDEFPEMPNPFGDRAAGVAWLESEWPCLVALCRIAAARGLYSLCWQLAFALREFFYLAKLWGPWVETHLAAVESAKAAGTRAWQAIGLGNLGVAHSDRGDLTLAVGYFRQALSLYQDLQDEHGIVNTISNLAWAEFYLGEYGKSIDGFRTALDHYRRLGNRRNVAITLRGIALMEAELKRCPAALRHAQKARQEFHALGLELDVVMSVNCMAWAHFQSGDHQAAKDAYEEALGLAEDCGSRYEKARALTGLGNIHQVSGAREAAVELWARADALYGGLEPVMLGEARVRLAS